MDQWERLLEEIDENDNVTLAYRDDGGVQILGCAEGRLIQ